MKNKRKKQSNKLAKKQARFVAEYLNDLISHMRFIDRIRFLFSGNFYRPMKNTARRMQLEQQKKAVKDAKERDNAKN